MSPVVWLLDRLSRLPFTFSWEEVAGPKGTCSADSFRRAAEYAPRPEDVFIATPMRCGTTWMQHVAYQILTRGAET